MTTPALAGSQAPSLSGIPRAYIPVTPSDSDDLANWQLVTGLYFPTAGTVSFTMRGNAQAQSTSVPAGFLMPGMFRRVRATGTTATGIMAAYG